jgi:hypothetical protein
MAHLAANPLIQNGRIPLDPAPDRDMIDRQASLRHDLLQVAIRQRIPQIPANAEEDDRIFEVPSPEQCWSLSGHDTPYQISSRAFATQPSVESFQNRPLAVPLKGRELQPESGILDRNCLVTAQQQSNEPDDGQKQGWHLLRLFGFIPWTVKSLRAYRIMANHRIKSEGRAAWSQRALFLGRPYHHRATIAQRITELEGELKRLCARRAIRSVNRHSERIKK